MRTRVHGRFLLVGLLAVGTAAQAQTAPPATGVQSPQERKREDILRELGLKKKPPTAPAPNVESPAGEAAPPEKGDETAATPVETKSAATRGATSPAPATQSFARGIHPQLVTACKVCHTPGGVAAASHFLLVGEPVADHRAVVRFVDVRNPGASALLAKAAGTTLHGGGALWPASGAPYRRLVTWIREGARFDGGAASVPAAKAVAPSVPAAPPPRRPKLSEVTTAEPVAVPAAESPPAAPVVEAPPPSPLFTTKVHPTLMSTCAVCHRPGGPAAITRLSLSGDAIKDEAAVRALVDPAAAEQSLLVSKAAGQMHAGGAILPAGDARLQPILEWITGLAVPSPTASVAVATPLPSAAPPTQTAPAPHAPAQGPAAPPLALPLGFMLNGRFSVDYERRDFTGNPFGDASVNALRSHHHYLFLSREAAREPCGLSVEILTLQFWEAHCRVAGLPEPLRLTVAAGKILVPFGADPLYHQSYGGLAGIDQTMLPVIWAVEGAAAHLAIQRRGLVVTDDLFVVRGYQLAHADAVINLQNDVSSVDHTKPGWGNRLGVAWLFASAWYSAYYNPLGFGRHLFMQALDINVWRPRGVPVLQHFSLGLGLFRADVSGGGAGVGGPGFDYYHFGDYLQLRYHPTDWLYVQYRTGVRRFDNRRGVILDKSRLTNADASTHNFAVVGRHGALTLGLYYFINIEKVDEVPNDLLRLSVIYDL